MNFRKIYPFLLIVSLTMLSCGKEPIFTEMKTSRLTIRLKGTFETEGPSNFALMSGQHVNISNPSDPSYLFQDDSVDDVSDSSSLSGATATGQDIQPTKLMLDIAEIRLGGKKISNYRQVLEIPLDDNHPFFNGKGVELKTDDPGDGYYDSVQVFFRKMIFDNAKVYRSTGSGFAYEKDLQVIFHEDTRLGFDFNQLMVNSYWDSLRLESGKIIRVFPMSIPIIGGLTYNRENDETVIEIRLVIKNFIKKYEYDYYEGGVYKVCHYYAPSDWLRDVRAGENDIGRNLHGVARAYVPANKGSITVNNAAGGYVVAIPSTETLSDFYLTANGKTLRDAVVGDMPLPPSYPGAYIEAVLDYYLKYEKYKNDWNTEHAALTSANVSGCTDNLCKYEYYWDIYEGNMKGFASGLKIPPYVGYGTSVTFSNMAPGTYNFYRVTKPAYGELFLDSAFSAPVSATINANVNNTVTLP